MTLRFSMAAGSLTLTAGVVAAGVVPALAVPVSEETGAGMETAGGGGSSPVRVWPATTVWDGAPVAAREFEGVEGDLG